MSEQHEQERTRPWPPQIWLPAHPDAQDILAQIVQSEPATFYANPFPAGLLLAQDKESYIMRVGALVGARRISYEHAAALVRGLGVSLLNPHEGIDLDE